MMQTKSGAFRLGSIAGIDVFVHWSWLLVAIFEIRGRQNAYTSQVWNAVEYLTLFAIVLLHEFGHSLACRSVGGKADRIMLWPLGGVAFVSPPPRPGALLWSIAAGPLVNVALVPVTVAAYLLAARFGLKAEAPDAALYLFNVALLNGVLLVFNLLPIYPLDGGQIAQALLWFVIGRAKSLYLVSTFGLVVGLGLIGLSAWARDWWFGLMSLLIASQCWAGFQQARALSRMVAATRRDEFVCPACKESPPEGAFWRCSACRTQFDTFVHQAVCPQCQRVFEQTQCPRCHAQHPLVEWIPVQLVPGAEG